MGAASWWLIAFSTHIRTDRILQNRIQNASLFLGSAVSTSERKKLVSGTAGARFGNALICRRAPWQRGVTRTALERKKDNHPHEGSVMDLLHPSVILPGPHPSIAATPSLLINESWWTRRLSLAINTGPSEKIHSQIRRPSFSDSLLTLDSKRVLTGPQKHYLGPNRAFPRTRRVSDSKMLPPSGQDSFQRSNEAHSAPRAEGVAGAHHSVCRGRSVSRLSPSLSL